MSLSVKELLKIGEAQLNEFKVENAAYDGKMLYCHLMNITCAEAVASGKADLGVVCCGTGIGISIAANKVKGIRCGLCTSVEMAELTKKHNNANMIVGTQMELPAQINDVFHHP